MKIHSIYRLRRPSLLLALCVTLGAASISAALAADPLMGTPDILSEAPIHALPQAAYQPSKDVIYKAVFSLTRAADSPKEASPALLGVARAVNLYVAAGVPLDHLKFVAIVHGPATGIVLDDDHYRTKFGTPNPNAAIIRKLKAAGVDVAVCGQAVLGQHYELGWIGSDVTVALSALTTIIGLEQQGYALVPL